MKRQQKRQFQAKKGAKNLMALSALNAFFHFITALISLNRVPLKPHTYFSGSLLSAIPDNESVAITILR